MAKKTEEKGSTKNDKDLEKEAAVDEEEDEEEADDEEDEDEEDEDEGHDEAVTAKPAKDDRRHHRPAARDHDDDDDDGAAEEEDATWWAPHAVLGVLVLIGVLGFFGVFNKALGFMAAKPAGGSTDTSTATPPATPKAGTEQPRPQQSAQQPQPPREMFGAKHLLVMYKGSKRAPANIERTKEEAKARAEEAQKKAKEGKIKFEDLVKEYSDEPGAGARGGDLGRFPKGAMVPEFQAGLEKIKVNEISDVVETPFGFHVILRTQ